MARDSFTNARADAVARYIGGGMEDVQGWLHPASAEMIVGMADAQVEAGVSGAGVEIGVHHGKLFILLKLLLAEAEPAVAIDLFEDQAKNVDLSGKGDRGQFVRNLERFCGRADDVRLLAGSSLDVRAEQILELAGGPVRIFSVDGGHTAECTENDLRLAEAVLAPQGFVVLDDYFNPHWPDVSIGAARVISDDGLDLAPVAVGPNKLLLARRAAAEGFREALRARFDHLFIKTSEMAGAPVEVYGVSHGISSVVDYAKLTVRRGRYGRSLVNGKRKVASWLGGGR